MGVNSKGDKMKLSISNIAWSVEADGVMYEMMKEMGFTGLEIAPTRIFQQNPYEELSAAKNWSNLLFQKYRFFIPSMQSIWYGKQENIFGTEEEFKVLVEYTKKAVDFADTINCKSLVFGCPRNRNIPKGADSLRGIKFFKEIADYALSKGRIIGMEANPPIYNTNYINDTLSAIELIKMIESEGFKLNLDVGTMIHNDESIGLLKGNVGLISHVHISEPRLKPIEKRKIHQELKELLMAENYQGFVSIEMGKIEDLSEIKKIMEYVGSIFL